ncbi:unnamed protein product [Soboliphyme baturini]|uniref:ANK_REP_REGION domain-containing protein n=1 Tax=Soboliphyme baturini TaxID=241478 RepID=A0A183I9F5_9BILA|nr:unnamed protein product [Soboliphyme baturini]
MMPESEDPNIILQAVSYGNAELLRQILDGGNGDFYRPNLALHSSTSPILNPLHVAAVKGDTRCLTILLNAGAQVNAVSSTASGSKVSYLTLRHSYLWLIYAHRCFYFVLTLQTALHLAAELGNLTACQILVSHGADLFHRDADGNTPLQSAQIFNHQRVSCYLMEEIEKRQLKITDLKSRTTTFDVDVQIDYFILGLYEACKENRVLEAEKILNEAGDEFLPDIVNGFDADKSTLLSK